MSASIHSLKTAARIAWDVAAFRLRKREMGNLATTLALAVALALPWGEVLYRALFALVLNVFVYLVNDCFDVAIDLRAPGRDSERTRFLAANLDTAWRTCGALALALCAMGAAWSLGLLVTAMVNVAVIAAYSKVLKHRAGWDVAAMGAWGVSMAMAGFPLDRADGWRLVALLGALSMVTECVQVLRDEVSDRAADVRTTAVVLGARQTRLLARALTLAAAGYASLALHPVGAVLALGALVPLTPGEVDRSWDKLRALFGVTWLALLALRRLSG
ncbi:MAG: UbiA family prenyltransferase [Polyangiales bacterium]